jgi:hypothetical protein
MLVHATAHGLITFNKADLSGEHGPPRATNP